MFERIGYRTSELGVNSSHADMYLWSEHESKGNRLHVNKVYSKLAQIIKLWSRLYKTSFLDSIGHRTTAD